MLVYWGFTATTGGSNNNQSVRFTNTSTFNPINDLVICETDTVTITHLFPQIVIYGLQMFQLMTIP